MKAAPKAKAKAPVALPPLDLSPPPDFLVAQAVAKKVERETGEPVMARFTLEPFHLDDKSVFNVPLTLREWP